MNRTLAAVLISPLTAAAAFSAALLAFSALSRLNAALPLIAGGILYLPLHFSAGKGRFFYVLAHELSHALAALVSGVKVRRIKVRRDGGYVAMDSTNAFISLAPYFVPFYALAAGAAYIVAGYFMDMAPYRRLFIAATGFLLAFHMLNTFEILSGPLQSDLKKAGGAVFSFSMVILLNSLCLALALKLIFPDLVSIKAYAWQVWASAGSILRWLWAASAWCCAAAKEYLG